MTDASYNLAIETTGPGGEIALGRGDELLATVALGHGRRHNVELMAGIAALCEQHHVTPAQLAEIYVSVGPGGFTGIRVSVAIAQSLGQALGARLIAVPTLDVVAQNVGQPGDEARDASDEAVRVPASLVVCLSLKRATVWAASFAWRDDHWHPAQPPRVCEVGELLSEIAGPVGIVGDPLPPLGDLAERHDGLVVFHPRFAMAHAQHVWRIGRECAAAGQFVKPPQLLPEYARRPEAVELWEQRHGPV